MIGDHINRTTKRPQSPEVDNDGNVYVTGGGTWATLIADLLGAFVGGLLGVSVRQSVYRDQIPITVDDTSGHDFALCDAIYVVTGGDLKFLNEQGVARTVTVLDGSIVPFSATRVYATGTSAGTQTGLLALYYEPQV